MKEISVARKEPAPRHRGRDRTDQGEGRLKPPGRLCASLFIRLQSSGYRTRIAETPDSHPIAGASIFRSLALQHCNSGTDQQMFSEAPSQTEDSPSANLLILVYNQIRL